MKTEKEIQRLAWLKVIGVLVLITIVVMTCA